MFSEIHNIIEDTVFAQVASIFAAIEKEDPDVCTCYQCKVDTACYVLNRIPPRYLISNRGVVRAGQESIERQQTEADIVSMIYEGLRRVNHNQRPYANHRQNSRDARSLNAPSYNIPTIIGRLYSGLNFEPISGIFVELWSDGKLAPMKDANWQNPYKLVANTQGTFTFWPASIPAEAPDLPKIFEYTIKIETLGFESLNHFMKIPVISELQSARSFSMNRTFKLPDLYLFPPQDDDD